MHRYEKATLRLDIYPNPFTDSVSVRPVQSGTYTIKIVDLNGAHIASYKVCSNAGEDMTINPHIDSGVYIALVCKGDEILCAKQIVKK